MRPLTKAEKALAEEAMAVVPVVINAMNRSFPGIRRKLAGIDATSVAYVAVCRATQTYDPDKSRVTTYFSAAIRNALLKELAKSQRHRYDSPDRVSMEQAERETCAQGSQSKRLLAALSVMPEEARALIDSRYYCGMSIKEMGLAHRCNQKKMRLKLKQAMAMLAEILGTDAGLPSPPS
jgi:RNA polymerase sigma factor (sigma-70 family)